MTGNHPMPVDPKRVQAVFLAAVVEQDLAVRSAIVDCECGADIDLRLRVEALLRAHDQPEGHLDHPVVAGAPLAAGSSTEPDVEGPAVAATCPMGATRDHTPSPDDTGRPTPTPGGAVNGRGVRAL